MEEPTWKKVIEKRKWKKAYEEKIIAKLDKELGYCSPEEVEYDKGYYDAIKVAMNIIMEDEEWED